VAGVLLLVPAAGLITGGGILLGMDAARDRTGYVTSPALRMTSATAAITAENLTIADTGQWTSSVADIGGLRVTTTSPSGGPVFVGIAPQPAVDAWLAGTAHDELTDVPAGRAEYSRAAGELRPVADPAAQTFWLTTATGPGAATMQWHVVDGNYAVVVANADGSPGIVADVRGAVQLPDLTGLGGGVLTAGIVLGALGLGLIVLGGVGLGRRHGQQPPGSGPVGPLPEQIPPVPVAS
jgi:hypothetical protein